jgi:hypothetical protein
VQVISGAPELIESSGPKLGEERCNRPVGLGPLPYCPSKEKLLHTPLVTAIPASHPGKQFLLTYSPRPWAFIAPGQKALAVKIKSSWLIHPRRPDSTDSGGLNEVSVAAKISNHHVVYISNKVFEQPILHAV